MKEQFNPFAYLANLVNPGQYNEKPLRIPQQGDTGTITPIQRNPLYGVPADLLQALHNTTIRNPNEMTGAEFISNLAGIPALAKTLDRLSGGFQLHSGSGQATQLLPETRDALLAVAPFAAKPAVAAAKAVVPAAKAVGRGAIKIATSPQMQAKLERVAELTGAAPMYAKPEGNLNFQPIVRASSLKGPDKQPLQNFIQQMKSQKGVTKAGTEYGLDVLKVYDPTTKITKQEFEDLLTPSRYSKVDLAGASDNADMHLWNQAGENIPISDVYNRMGIPPHLAEEGDELAFYADLDLNETGPELREALRRIGITNRDDFLNLRDEAVHEAHNARYEDLLSERGPASGYQYEGTQRLIEPDYTGQGNGLGGEYFELGVTHPAHQGSYHHYQGAPSGTIGHIRGSVLPESYMDMPLDIQGVNFELSDPGAMLIEELQADSTKARHAQNAAASNQEGPYHQIHGTLAKSAIQHALEKGIDRVYFPSSHVIAAQRGQPHTAFAPIYDQAVVKEAINPLRNMSGVTIEEILHPESGQHLFNKLQFTPEAIEEILKGSGQTTPGYADGGSVKSDFFIDPSSYAQSRAKQMFPKQKSEWTQQDAARHMLASGMMAQKFGPTVAKIAGLAHEHGNAPVKTIGYMLGIGKMPPDYDQDLHNNALGVQLGKEAKSQEDLESRIQAILGSATKQPMPGQPWIGRPNIPNQMSDYAQGGMVKPYSTNPFDHLV